MRIRHIMFPVMLLGLLFLFIGCGENYPESAQTLKLDTQPVSGSNTRLLSITSGKHWFDQRQNEVRPKLKAIINEGEYNITSVKTVYLSGYLTAAEITYDASCQGDGNHLRVLFIHSNKYYRCDKDAEIKARLAEIMDSGKYNIVKVRNIHNDHGYLIAAEVYYKEV